MNLMHSLAQLLHGQQTQAAPQAHPAATAIRRYEDGSAQVGQIQTPAAVYGNPTSQMRVWEDGSGVNMGRMPMPNVQQQGFNLPQMGFGQQLQGVGGFPNSLQGLPGAYNNPLQKRGMVNPQVRDNGFYYNQ